MQVRDFRVLSTIRGKEEKDTIGLMYWDIAGRKPDKATAS